MGFFSIKMVISLPEDTSIHKISVAFFKQEFPADLALAVVWLVASIGAIYIPILNATPVRIVLAIPFL